MDIAVWILVAFIILVVVRRNISFFEIPLFNLCVAYRTLNFIHGSLFHFNIPFLPPKASFLE
jgi:hypothetical protein